MAWTRCPSNREKEYIDPATAVSLEDIRPLAQDAALQAPSQASELSSGVTFADATPSIEYCFDAFDSRRGRGAPGAFTRGRR